MKISIRVRSERVPAGHLSYRGELWEFAEAKDASVFMWGKDTSAYEFSVGGVWHRFTASDIAIILLEIALLQYNYNRAKKRRQEALRPLPAPKLTWRDALPR